MERCTGLSRRREWQCSKVDLIRHSPVKERRMWTAGAIELDGTPDTGLRLEEALVGVQMHLLVLDAVREALDKEILAPGTLAGHGL